MKYIQVKINDVNSSTSEQEMTILGTWQAGPRVPTNQSLWKIPLQNAEFNSLNFVQNLEKIFPDVHLEQRHSMKLHC